MTDHLGNVRTRCIDKNKNGKIDISKNDQNKNELGASYHYYPFGLQMEGNFFQPQGVKNKYRYNGIEFNEELGVDLSFATYRTLDAAVGRWLQVDPKAETLYGMTPYNSMGNNPILHSDPNGDVLPALVVAAIALAAVNGTMNVVGQALQGNVTSFWQGLEYFGVGAISGAVTIFNPVLGRVINAGGNKIVQLANGQWSPTDIDSGKDVLFLAVDVGLDLLQPGMSNGLAKPIASSINRAIEKKAYEAFVKSLGKDVITSSWKGGFKVLGGTVELTSKAAAKGATNLFKAGISQFKNTGLTNAGRAATKHPQYFGFKSTEALMKVHSSPAALNSLGSQSLKDVLRNGVQTTGAGGRYPNGWTTYTLKNGNAASWTLDDVFIGFRGIK